MIRPHRILVALLACAALGTQLVAPSPASAATSTITGGGTWGGVVTLPRYPCVGTCFINASNFTGWFAGSVTAVVGSTTYTATWPSGTANNLIPGTISYTESCGAVAALPPDTGAASGNVSITGGVLLQDGAPDGTATLTAWMDWSRTEDAVIITVSSVALLNGAGTTIATAQDPGAGAGLFGVPVPTTLGNLPPSCSYEESVSVAIGGIYVQAQ